MTLKNGPITQDELMQRLARARKVQDKVDSGDYVTGNIDENAIVSDENDNATYDMGDMLTEETVANITPVNSGELNIDKINQSKLPDVIKKAMIENPIPQISLNDTSLSMDFVKKTKRLMEQEGVGPKSSSKILPIKTNQSSSNINSSQLTSLLTPIIENIIRKSLDEIVDKKLNQILTAHQTATLNENLVLKVGESIFKGKITGVSKAK